MQKWKGHSWQVWAFILLSSACQSQPPLLSGEIQGLTRDSIYLFKWNAGIWEKVAATGIQNGKFSFQGALPTGLYLWGISPQEGDMVLLNGKDTPHIKGTVAQLFQTYTYEKSPENEAILRFRRAISGLYQQLNQRPPQEREGIQRQIDSLLQNASQSSYATLRVYASLFRSPTLPVHAASPRLVWQGLVNAFWKDIDWQAPILVQIPEVFMRMQGFWQNALAQLPEDSVWQYGEAWVKKLPPALHATAWMALINAAQQFQLRETMVYGAEQFLAVAPQDPRRNELRQFIQSEGALRRGQPAPDIALPDPEGKIRRLSELRGKWVLIDFWASWCRPCRMENPNVVRLYQQYHPRGFEIFGVSLDHNKEAWLQAIQADKLTWIHVSDLKGWQSAGAQLYRVSGIPYTVLVDPEGRIAAKNLRGPTLEAKLKEIFP